MISPMQPYQPDGEVVATTEPDPYAGMAEVPCYGVLAPEGIPSGDDPQREFAPGSLTWAPLPIPFKWQEKEDEGHEGACVTGRIDAIWRDGALIRWVGSMVPQALAVMGATITVSPSTVGWDWTGTGIGDSPSSKVASTKAGSATTVADRIRALWKISLIGSHISSMSMPGIIGMSIGAMFCSSVGSRFGSSSRGTTAAAEGVGAEGVIGMAMGGGTG